MGIHPICRVCQNPKTTPKCQSASCVESRRNCHRRCSRAWKDKNDIQHKANVRADIARKREIVIKAYGSACQCCGENESAFLAIDHVQGGGTKERAQGITSRRLYLKLIRENFPDTYQLLCHNCNTAKYRLGTCPHVLNGMRVAA